MIRKTGLLFICALLLIGCQDSPTVGQHEILLDVPHIKVTGGYCGQGVIVMSAAYLQHQTSVTQDDLTRAISWNTSQLLLSDMPILAREVFGFSLVWGTYSAMNIRWQLQQGLPVIIVVNGWRNYKHVLLIIGIRGKEWVVHDPTGEAFVTMPIEAEYQGFLIEKGTI